MRRAFPQGSGCPRLCAVPSLAVPRPSSSSAAMPSAGTCWSRSPGSTGRHKGLDTGARIFSDLALRGVGSGEAEIDAYIRRARDRDSDLWVVEIEDREGRHFLVEPVETPENNT